MLGSIVAGLVFVGVMGFQFVGMGFHVSKNFHSKITKSVLRSPMSFFDTNPVGSILTRFAQDAHTIDASFSLTMYNIAITFQRLITQFCTCIIACYLTTPAFFLLMLLGFIIIRSFNDTVISIRDCMSTKRAKINSFFVLLNEGLPSIRATGRQRYFRRKLFDLSDEYADAVFTFIGITSAEMFLLVIIGTLSFPAFLGLVYAFPQYTYTPLLPGALMGAVGPIQVFAMVIDFSILMQNQLVSVRRILEYKALPSEELEEKDQALEEIIGEWPRKGKIEFRNVCLKYAQGKDFALKGASFVVPGNSKVGVVGRTGAGKSSIL